MRRVAAVLAMCSAAAGAGQSITSAGILQASADLDCLGYEPVGTCFWGYWTTCCCAGTPPLPYPCYRTRTSVKYRHWSPDLTVTAYPASGLSPWSELNELVAPLAGSDGGTPARGTGARAHTGLRFKMSEAFGSPGLAWMATLGALGIATGMVCPSVARPMQPYYVSALDAAMWRDDGVLQAAAVAADIATSPPRGRLLKEPGASGAVWGPIYGRSGFVQQGHDYRAAAVVAMRVADIVTRSGQLHVYTPVGYSGAGSGYWPPAAPVTEEDAEHRWQMLVPAVSACARFAASVSAYGASDRDGPKQSDSGAYVFNLWREYECCRDRGDFLGDSD